MADLDFDIVIGIHSIVEALRNEKRSGHKLYLSSEGMGELKKRAGATARDLEGVQIINLESHALQEEGKRLYKEIDMKFSRIPSQAFLVTTPIEIVDITWIYDQMGEGKNLSILCLDQITDVHNAAAIMRSAAFYGVDCVLISQKGNFGMGPNFARIASGALEYVKIVKCSSLPKAIKKLIDQGVEVVGFSEHAEGETVELIPNRTKCLVMGAEDVGISNALMRIIPHTVALRPHGEIKSLNVSVAAAVAMERFFR
ncbi:MAG: hypothetical protein KAG61_13105 [Bacteriovoracaceae bacterium]|nr:hypothetical protein [Bacteriovoracaceae bacterium]